MGQQATVQARASPCGAPASNRSIDTAHLDSDGSQHGRKGVLASLRPVDVTQRGMVKSSTMSVGPGAILAPAEYLNHTSPGKVGTSLLFPFLRGHNEREYPYDAYDSN